MSILYRRDVAAFLADFVAQRPGLRLGRMFGVPAAYAGRKLFACAYEDGLTCKLPAEVAEREMAGRAAPFRPRNRPMKSWVIYRPRTPADLARLAPLLELAARYVAQPPRG